MSDELFELFVNMVNCRCYNNPLEILKDFKYTNYEWTDEYINKVHPLKLKYLEPISDELIHRYNIPEEYQKEEFDNILSGLDQYLNCLFDKFIHKLIDLLLG